MSICPVAPMLCPSCNFEASAGSRYCANCGRQLVEEQARNSATKLRAHRELTLRTITVLFCDIASSTDVISRLPSETALKILNIATDRLADAEQAAGGTVLERMGDGLMPCSACPSPWPTAR